MPLKKLLTAFKCSHSTKLSNKTKIFVINIYCTVDRDSGSHLFHGVLTWVESFETRPVHHCSHWSHTEVSSLHRTCVQMTSNTKCEVIHTELQKAAQMSHGGNRLLHSQSGDWILQALTGSGHPGANSRWDWCWYTDTASLQFFVHFLLFDFFYEFVNSHFWRQNDRGGIFYILSLQLKIIALAWSMYRNHNFLFPYLQDVTDKSYCGNERSQGRGPRSSPRSCLRPGELYILGSPGRPR